MEDAQKPDIEKYTQVYPLKAKWAALVFSGRKKLEIRKKHTPLGLVGIAVSGLPDVIVGSVRVTQSRSMSSSHKLVCVVNHCA